MSPTDPGRRRPLYRDPLQVNLRWVIMLVLLAVVLPTILLSGFAIFLLLRSQRETPGLLMGILIASFSASVVAGAALLVFLTRRSARLAQLQETFLSRMSHELLTPLAGIRLHSQILRGALLPAGARSSVEAILRESDRLQALVERIVTWRKHRGAPRLLGRTPTTVQRVVDEALRRAPEAASVRVRVLNPALSLNADPEALAEVIVNLLQNALKYAGGDGPIEFTARRLGRMAVFAVTDRGPGLPPGPKEQLFDPFFRFVAPDRADPGGSGLGLSIARQIVRAHGGKLSAFPRRGGGSSFFFVLPVGSGS